MPPTVVVLFGNPRLGTPLMLSRPSVAIDPPMKMLTCQDKAGRVSIGDMPTAALKRRHQLAEQDASLTSMAGALDALAKAASGQSA